MELPTKKTKPETDASRFTTVICGPSGVGKSTFAANIPNALFLDCDDGLGFLEVYQKRIVTWDDMVQAYEMLRKDCGKFTTVVVDTVDVAYTILFREVCKDMKIKFPDEGNSSSVYGTANLRFASWLQMMKMLPVGLVLLAHSSTKQKQTRTGKVDYTEPALSATACRTVKDNAYFGFMAEIEAVEGENGAIEERRIIRTRSGVNHWAKDRTGLLPETIPLDYAQFDKAYKTALKAAQKGQK